jgi:hypothetical protein
MGIVVQYDKMPDRLEPDTCANCKTEQHILVSPPSTAYRASGLYGVPLLGYARDKQIDPTTGLRKVHSIIPVPHLTEAYLIHYITKGGGRFMCYICHGRSQTLGTAATITSTTPRNWMTWFLQQTRHSLPESNSPAMPLHKQRSVTALAVDFYLSNYILLMAREHNLSAITGVMSTYVPRMVEKVARTIHQYLVRACLGEARHMGKSVWGAAKDIYIKQARQEGLTHIVHLIENDAQCEWCKWFRLHISGPSGSMTRDYIYGAHLPPRTFTTGLLRVAADVFNASFLWGSGYGGPLWAIASEIGASYEQGNFRQNFTLCDRVFNITHNGSTIFNKPCGPIYTDTAPTMLAALETKAIAKYYGEYAWMSGYASSVTRTMYLRLAQFLLDEGGPVLWDAEKRG